jgi:hydrogenase-4 component B
MSRLGGLWRAMPWTAALFALGSLAVVGLPPLNGFVGEWLVYLGLFDAATSGGAWVALPAAILLAMAGALALASFVKACAMVFLGAERTRAAASAKECGPWMRGPMLGLAAICIAIGLAPALVWPAVARAVGSWQPGWGALEAPAPFATLGLAHLALATLGLVAAGGLWQKTRSNGLRRASTWDCGYAVPTARMQYTSGSFGAIATGWLYPLLVPARVIRRARGILPQRASRIERMPDSVLEHVIEPAAGAVMTMVEAARRLQHGRLQSYILYIVLGLAAVAAVAALGASR